MRVMYKHRLDLVKISRLLKSKNVEIKKTITFKITIKFKYLFLYSFSGVCVIEFLLNPIDK